MSSAGRSSLWRLLASWSQLSMFPRSTKHHASLSTKHHASGLFLSTKHHAYVQVSKQVVRTKYRLRLRCYKSPQTRKKPGCLRSPAVHDLDMRSKVHPKHKTKYRVGNWSAYEQALVQRGDVTLWLSADATDAWRPSPSGRPGAPKTFSDCAIETAVTRRLVFPVALAPSGRLLAVGLVVDGCRSRSPRPHHALPTKSVSRG